MFFLAKGNIMVHTSNNKQFKLPSGIALGEIALMRPMSKRTATLTAHNKCEVFLLNQEAFDRLRSGYPALAQDVRQMVSGYLRNDSALYVAICMRASARVCYFVGGCFFAIMYALIFIGRH
jgi:CRP-like cAMP-binding protein